MQRTLGILCLVGVVACGSDSTAPGNTVIAPALDVLSGNNQTGQAGGPQLAQGVVVRAGYTSTSGATIHGLSNQIVCLQAVVNGITPFTPCVNTDNAGNATFFIAPGTVAGVERAEVRAQLVVNGVTQPVVTDTVKLNVTPGPAHEINILLLQGVNGETIGMRAAGDSIYIPSIVGSVRDRWYNFIDSTTLSYRWYVYNPSDPNSNPYPQNSGSYVRLPADAHGERQVFIYADSAVATFMVDVQ